MKCQTVKTINCLATSVSAFTLPLFLTLSISLSVFLSFHLSLPDSPPPPNPPPFFYEAWPCRLIREVSSRLALLLSEPVCLPFSTLTTVMLMPWPHSVKSFSPPHTWRHTPNCTAHLRSTVTCATVLQYYSINDPMSNIKAKHNSIPERAINVELLLTSQRIKNNIDCFPWGRQKAISNTLM